MSTTGPVVTPTNPLVTPADPLVTPADPLVTPADPADNGTATMCPAVVKVAVVKVTVVEVTEVKHTSAKMPAVVKCLECVVECLKAWDAGAARGTAIGGPLSRDRCRDRC